MIKLNYKSAMELAGGVVLGALVVIGVDKFVDRLTHYGADGFDKYGFDREGFNIYGFNADGYNRSGYNIDGFDRHGFDKQGFDCEGFDCQGFAADGYNRDGRDRRGFNRDGYDAEGFDHYGRDAEGYYRNGYGLDGFNRDGFDRQGYGRNFYNKSGFDRAGKNTGNYVDHIGKLYRRLRDAQHQMENGVFRYAINDARLVMEETLRLVVEHASGTDSAGDGLLENLKICENKRLLPADPVFIDRLHDVRHICNEVIHELSASDRLTHRKTFFVIMQIRNLLKAAETTLCYA